MTDNLLVYAALHCLVLTHGKAEPYEKCHRELVKECAKPSIGTTMETATQIFKECALKKKPLLPTKK
jgi:hypothetical protein